MISAFLISMLACSMLNTSPSAAQEATPGSQQTQPLTKTDSVYVFFSPSCPVCKASTAALKNLQKEYTDVAFVAVIDSSIADSAEMVEYFTDYKYRIPYRWDSKELAARFKATTTPEVVVLHNGRRVYQGRIDNQFEALGKRRRVVSVNDLRDVLATLATGLVPSFRRTIPVGCYLEK